MHRMIGGILLVAGTTVGAGMLALPVVTGFAGFLPAAALFIVFWLVMTFTALLILEVNLWMTKPHGNMITMAEMTLGKWGKAISWCAYLFLLYALTTAYLAGGGPIVNEFLLEITGWQFPKTLESLPLLVLFGYFIYRGTKSVDYLNRILMVGLVITYVLTVILLTPEVKPSLLTYSNAPLLWMGSSVIATSFGFHIIIPSLTHYLHRDVAKLKKVILIGSLIPLIVYLIWEGLVLGIVPLDKIAVAFKEGTNGAQLLINTLNHGLLAEILRFFLLFAIVTSFLGVSMSLSDFLADGFNIQRTAWGNIGIMLLTFGPPLGFALTDPRAFLTALEYAGAFGVMFLLGILPALMVWQGRKKYQSKSTYKAPGGKLLLVAVMVFCVLIIGIEVLQKIGVLT